MNRIGLFGGSFDPVHNAHLALAQAALAELKLDQLHWVPAGKPWQKARELAPAIHRAAMVRLALEGEPRFVLDASELHRDGPSYSIDTVRQLHAQQADAQCYLIIGQDQYTSLHTWRDWQELLSRVTLAVANRPGVAMHADERVHEAHRQAVSLPMMNISSTDIRARVAAGQGIADLAPAAVARYIDHYDLYRGTPRS